MGEEVLQRAAGFETIVEVEADGLLGLRSPSSNEGAVEQRKSSKQHLFWARSGQQVAGWDGMRVKKTISKCAGQNGCVGIYLFDAGERTDRGMCWPKENDWAAWAEIGRVVMR